MVFLYQNLSIIRYHAASNAIALRPHFVHLASDATTAKLYLFVDVDTSVYLMKSFNIRIYKESAKHVNV